VEGSGGGNDFDGIRRGGGGGPTTAADERPRGGRGHACAGLRRQRAKGKERGHGARQHSLKRGQWWGGKGRGGPVLGVPPGGGTGGLSRARRVMRRREGPGQRHAPGATVPG
jgi:hypothetical protein